MYDLIVSVSIRCTSGDLIAQEKVFKLFLEHSFTVWSPLINKLL